MHRIRAFAAFDSFSPIRRPRSAWSKLQVSAMVVVAQFVIEPTYE